MNLLVVIDGHRSQWHQKAQAKAQYIEAWIFQSLYLILKPSLHGRNPIRIPSYWIWSSLNGSSFAASIKKLSPPHDYLFI